MKTINLRAIAAAALISCGLSVASPLCAAAPAPTTPDTALVQSQTDSFALERLRLELDYKERMAGLMCENEVDFLPILGIVCTIALPLLLTFLYFGYRLKKKHDREKLEAQLLLDLAKSGQTLTPEIIEKLRKEPEQMQSSETATTRGMVKIFEGLAFVLLAPLLYVYVENSHSWAFYLLFPGLLFLAQGLGLLLGRRMRRPANENPAEKPQA